MQEVTPPRRRTPGQPAQLLPLGLYSLFVVAMQVLMVGSSCPRDVSTLAHTCFTSYSREYQNMQASPKRLCCGVDVETLRAFCSSYMHGMDCISDLKKRCPESKHGTIEEAMTNLHGAEEALKSLCSDDTNIEVYARFQSCFTRTGPTSEVCFQRHLNTSIQFMPNMDAKHMAEFCSDMRGAVRCIQDNVRKTCGEDAAKLATTLVKPMVRQSTKCDYNVVTKTPSSRQDNPTPSSHGGRQNSNGSVSGNLISTPAAILILLLACMLRTVM